jgi:eukaryotic-like serine/threonine-protein kinase
VSEQAFNENDPALAGWIDDVADEFESAWKGLRPPSLGDFLGTATGERRAALLGELLKIDRAYRRKLSPAEAAGDTPVGVGGETDGGAQEPQRANGVELAPAGGGDGSEVPGYEILGELGRGGMGVVYKARHLKLRRLVALKMVPAGAGAGPRRQRLLTEARAAARLQHPNIVQIYEVGEHAGQPFFALEYLEGGNLAARLAGVPQPPRLAAWLVETLARAIDFAHRHQIVHRDLKPHNVLLAGAPDTPLGSCAAKVSDFGLAKQLEGPADGQAPTW